MSSGLLQNGLFNMWCREGVRREGRILSLKYLSSHNAGNRSRCLIINLNQLNFEISV